MKYTCLLFCAVLLLSLDSCKKDSAAPTQSLLVGKWFVTKQASVLYHNGSEINSSTITKFTTTDFVEFYSDGTGYYSQASPNGPSIEEFTYALTGSALTEFTSVENKGVPATVTGLTADALSIHVVLIVPDPNDPTVADTEVDDYSYTR